MSLTAQPIESVKIFYSYAHEDEALRDELEKHLSNLERQGHIVLWHDRKIDAGKEWAHEIAANIQEAQIILLLISPDFMASQFCNESEVPLAMERHETEGVRVIPVILRPVDWQDTLFHKLQALPTNSKPITKWPDRDEAFLDVAKGIRKVVEELASKLSLAPAPPGGIQKKFSHLHESCCLDTGDQRPWWHWQDTDGPGVRLSLSGGVSFRFVGQRCQSR